MSRLIIAGSVVVVAALVAWWVQRRASQADVPTQPTTYSAPIQLDRNDFASPETAWLVAVFSSATCETCQLVVEKSKALASSQVVVQEIEYSAAKALHQRYQVDAVPTTVVADRQGVVQKSFIGPVSATDLWAAVADARKATD